MKTPILFISATAALLSIGALSYASARGKSTPSIGKAADATVVTTKTGKVSITPISDNIVRIARLGKGTSDRLPESRSAVQLPDSAMSVNRFVTADSYTAVSPAYKVEINRKNGEIIFYDKNNNPILADVTPFDVTIKGENTVTLLPYDKTAAFYGAGERGHSLKLNGDSLSLYNRQNYGYTEGDPRISQMGISVPMLASDKGYGILFDDYARAAILVGDSIRYVSQSPQQLSYYLIIGDTIAAANHFKNSNAPLNNPQTPDNSLAGIVSQYTHLTGRQPLPPLWTLGYITSKYGYKTQEETLAVVDSLLAKGYPLDGIVLDLYWYGVETDMGRLEWNPQQWPDHKEMLRTLDDKNVNIVLISQPYINKIGAIDNYNLLDSLGMLAKDATGKTHDVTTWVGRAGMFDVSNPDTKEWLWNRLKPLTAEGVDGWWGDLGEPEVHPDSIIHSNGLPAQLYHNQYGNDWSEIIYNGLRKDFPDKRPMLMMRGGTAGLQRYSVFPWTTDVSRSWGGLQPQIKLMLSSGLSGLAYMSSDLGGFAVDPSLPADPELYARWLQFGTFTPMMRTHAQEIPEPFNYPEVEDISHKYINIRYQWLPYNYSLAIENALYGWPLARPLNFRDTDSNPKLDNITDEYLWGDEVLIAPVFTQNARERKVTFPAGTWISWWNPKHIYKAFTTARVDAPLDQMPIFVKKGAFIPLYPIAIKNTGEYNPRFLSVKYFPDSRRTSYTMYEDDRKDPESIEKGHFQKITFQGQQTDKNIVVQLTSEGGYNDMPDSRTITFEIENLAKMPKKVMLRSLNGLVKSPRMSPSMITPQILRIMADSDRLVNYSYNYNPHTRCLTIRFPWGYSDTWLEILY